MKVLARRSRGMALLLGSLLALAGCDDETKPKPKQDPDAGPNAGIVDPNISKAMKGVASATADPLAANPEDGPGPPPTGVFGPGEADSAIARDAPIKVMSKGSAPQVKLLPSLVVPPQEVVLTMSYRGPGGALPTLDYTIRFQNPPPAKGEKGGEGDEEPSLEVAKPTMQAKITKVELSASQPGQLPEQVKKLLGTLAGTTIEADITTSGTLTNERINWGGELEGDALKPVGETLRDVVGIFFVPLPSEPIGVGGSWIAADRTKVMGMNYIRYRAVEVAALDSEKVTFKLTLRHYATSPTELPNIVQQGQEAVVGGLNSQGQGTWTRSLNGLAPLEGTMVHPMIMQLASPQNPQMQQALQFETKVDIKPVATAPANDAP